MAASCAWRCLRSVKGNGVAQLFEEPSRDLFGLAGEASDPSQERFLLRAQVLRHDDLDDDVLVAATPSSDVRHAPPAHTERLPVLRPGGDRDLDSTLERRYLDPVAECRLHHVHPELIDDVLVAPLQERMRLDPEHHVQVAGRSASDARLALAAEADL